MIYVVYGLLSDIDPGAWAVPIANVIGRLMLELGVREWFDVTLSGDIEEIRAHLVRNVRENCARYTDLDFFLVIGANRSNGNQAMLHGGTINDGSLNGMRPMC